MLGLCCQYLEPITKRNGTTEYVNSINEIGLQYNQFLKGKYSNLQVEKTWVNNANELLLVLKKVFAQGIRVFRVSSGLFPLSDSLPELLHNNLEVKSILSQVGKFALDNNIRITTHPDQYLVLSSNKQNVIDNSIKMFEHHAWMFDTIGLPVSPYYAINVHGGVKGNHSILIDSIKKLSYSAKNRLTLENDERAFNVKDLYSVYEETGVPCVFDTHHHTFNDAGLSIEEGLNLAKKTWSVKPLTHLSNTTPSLVSGSFTDRRKHSDYVHYIPECQKIANNLNEIDIEMEFKMKNLAIFNALKEHELVL